MPVKITMPALSPTMEEGTLARWLVKEGDKVIPGDVIAEIETDKAIMEVEAIDEGILEKILVPSGTQGVKVNSVIALLEEGDSEEEKIDSDFSKESEEDKDKTGGMRSVDSERVFSSPLARRMAEQKGVNIALLNGTGPGGRIVKSDVESAIPTQEVETVISLQERNKDFVRLLPGEYKIIPQSAIRRTIAQRLIESKRTVPHFYVSVDCEIDALLQLRSDLNHAAPVEEQESGSFPVYKLSVNDMIIKAVALALKQVPDAHVSWLDDENIIDHSYVDVAVAVSLRNGLITPIIRHADEKNLRRISDEIKVLVKRARKMNLKSEEYQGGTVAVSNMGMFGVKEFTAIINPPQATIFAIGAAEKRPVVKNGVLSIATMMTVVISADHRVIDGVLAANLAQAFKMLIENPFMILV
ncbi:MAG: pyruvate dehydrogenase E2 component (dihydrolipoamide acetyltransferase) [Candidatus Tokpelaia sp. JSC161]|nr:MAG: pyruvate dehydrogenase E2 component (dihydrolipoamide acetyltransferase) [Candidatus Tokpelaia sp. JSC161]